MNVLVWFKCDLRLEDHPALSLAAGLGAVLPLYIVEPEYWQQPDTSARQWEFTAECLTGLRIDLAARSMPLAVRVGDAVTILQRTCRQHRITRIISHQETGTRWIRERNYRVAAWARSTGVEWTDLPQAPVGHGRENTGAHQVWGSDFMLAPLASPTSLSPVPGVELGPIPTARALRLTEDRCPHRQRGGRTEGLHLLNAFLSRPGESGGSAITTPFMAERVNSRLSPHLALGVLSAREIAQTAAAKGAGPARLSDKINLRHQFIQMMHDCPHTESACLVPAAEKLRPHPPDASRLSAWAMGETGLPYLDACMRYLASTGWLNFPMRAMAVTTASYHLWLDWRTTGPILARAFTDYEPGIHWPQMQIYSGTTDRPAPRLQNPVKLGLTLDPTGIFIRRWLPELAPVPDAFLHQPWQWPGFRALAGRRYPEPIIDPVAAVRAARDMVGRLPGLIAAPRLSARTTHRTAKSGQLSLSL